MKIRLEITLDNGTSKETEIIGDPTPESILKLINQLSNLLLDSPALSTAVSSPQPTQNVIKNQSLPPDLPPQPTNNRGTRNFQMAEEEYSRLKNESLTIKERLELFLNFEYKDQWFTSLEVKRDYDRIYGQINLSTVSTYLSRLFREQKLERMGNRNQRKYRMIPREELQEFKHEVFDRQLQTY